MDATPRILVVDDSLTIRRALEFILRPQGYALEFAADGREAMSRASEFAPDLVLLDYVLPDMRGPDVCAELRAMPATAATPVVLVSAKGASIRQAYQDAENVVSYITKPFKPEVVSAVVANALARLRAAHSDRPVRARSGTRGTPGIAGAAPEGTLDGDAASPPRRCAPPPGTVEETFAALLGQLEEAIVGDRRRAAPREGGPGGRASEQPEAVAPLERGVRKASRRMAELAEQLAGGAIVPYRLCSDGSFASLAETLLEAHRSLCDAAIALAAAGAPGVRPPRSAGVVVAFPAGHPLESDVRRALEVAPEVRAVVVDGEFAQLPYLVRLLAPRCVIVAAGCDGALDDAWRLARVAAAEGTRFVAMGATPVRPDGELEIAEGLEDGGAVARLIGELALGAEPAAMEPVATGLEIVTV